MDLSTGLTHLHLAGVARQIWLPTLAQTVDARPGSDAKQLARMARQVAA